MKNKRTMRKMDRGNALAISAIVLCFMLTIGLSGFLNGGGFLSALSWTQDGMTYYALSSGCYDDILLARQDAEIIRERGGAGFVLSKDSVYHLLLNIYYEKSEAESVLSKQTSGAYLVEIYIDEYDYDWCYEGERSAVEKAVGAFHSTYLSLYKIANDIDKGELNDEDAIDKLTIELGKLEVTKTNLSNSLASRTDERLNLEAGLQTIITLVDALQNPMIGIPLASQIRYKSISILLVGDGL
ncbi:MAG: hypothetical protein PHE93_01175 [Clostridia bacterium]|nr:hypothetical protein [Clostridia bacterium]